MTPEGRARLLKQLQDAESLVMADKTKEYAQEENVNANFELVSSLLRGAPVDELTVVATYLLKHIASICNYVVSRWDPPSGEPIAGRLVDARNYLAILYSLIEEGE